MKKIVKMKLHAPLRVTWYLLILRFAKKTEAFIHGSKMRRGFLLHMIIFALIVSFFVFSQRVTAGELPQGVKPIEVTAQTQTMDLGLGDAQFILTFWNVGQLHKDASYGEATLRGVCIDTQSDWECVAGKEENIKRGTFSGGPNGTFSINNRTFSLENGTKAVASEGGAEMVFTVQNPEAFDYWKEKPIDEPAQESNLEDSGVAFSDVFGQVEVSIPRPDGSFDEESWELVSFREFFEKKRVLPVGTHIRTSEKSGGIISFADMTTFTLKPESEIVLSSPSSKDTAIQLLWGNLKANVTKMMKDGSMEVEMSQAVAGIKGTIFTLADTKDKSTIKVIDGSVSFKSKTSGQSETVNAGEILTADKNGLGQKTTFDVNAENTEWDKTMAEMKKSAGTKAASTDFKNYFYYAGIPIALVLGIAAFFISKRKKK